MDDNCEEWVECMGMASGCGEQEAGVASGSRWNLWVWLAGGGFGGGGKSMGVVVRRYIDFLILLIPIYSSCICSFFAASLLFVHL